MEKLRNAEEICCSDAKRCRIGHWLREERPKCGGRTSKRKKEFGTGRMKKRRAKEERKIKYVNNFEIYFEMK